MKKFLRNVLALLCLCVFLFSGWQVYRILQGYNTAAEQYTQLEQYVSLPAPLPPQPEPVPPAPSEEEIVPEPPTMEPTVDFEALSQINPDVVAWLTIEGTNVNYPVVQGEDNAYYLNHQFDKRRNTAGCLFLDAANSAGFTDPNSIIYGHYMNSGAMFANIARYKQQSFYDEHPTGMLITPDSCRTIRFFSGYVSDVEGSAWNRDFSPEEYSLWLEELVEKSCFSSDTVPAPQDQVVTLSTCSYEFQNARFVLHGVLVP